MERVELRPRQVVYHTRRSGELKRSSSDSDLLLKNRSKTVAEPLELQRLELVPNEEQIPQMIVFTQKRCKSEDLLDKVRLRVKQAL